jgi:hypothetical protein
MGSGGITGGTTVAGGLAVSGSSTRADTCAGAATTGGTGETVRWGGGACGTGGFTAGVAAGVGTRGAAGTATGHDTSGSTTIGGNAGGSPFAHAADLAASTGPDVGGVVAAAGRPV